jgi:uncharacterized protein (TIGR01244 family)
MPDVRPLSDGFAVAPQITVADVRELAALGYGFIVNNRPDGEAPGQPEGAEIEAAALEAGLGYYAIPVDHAGFSAEQVSALAALLVSPRRVLAYCRSGTRSAMLWALAQSVRGTPAASLVEAARRAGYDVRPLLPLMDELRRDS